MKIVAFGHQKRVGKDTAVKYIQQKIQKDLKIESEKRSFAEPLKHLAYHLWGWAGLKKPDYYEECIGDEREEILPRLKKSPRQLWLGLGLKVREIYEDTWSDLLLEGDNTDLILISDLRFPSEIEKIRRLKGIVIKIERPGILTISDSADSALVTYEGWDSIIVNKGDILNFYDKLDDVYYSKIKPYILGEK